MMPEYIKEYLTSRGLDYQLLDYGKYYERNWIVIPVKDKDGKVIFNKLRRDPRDDETVGKYRFYPPGSESCLFGLEVLPSYKDYVVICEGEFDCMLLRGKGINAITSTAGSSTFKEEWFKSFKHIPNIYICFDSDDAGKRGAEQLMFKLIQHDFNVYLLTLPDIEGVKDITDYFIKHEGTVERFWSNVERIQNIQLPILTLTDDIQQVRNEIFKFSELEDKYKKAKQDYHPTVYSFLMSDVKMKLRKAQSKVLGLQGYTNHIDVDSAKQVPLLTILDAYNIKHDNNYGNRIRFKLRQNERTPSAYGYLDQNTFYDYGVCGGGSVIDLVMELEGCEFKEALKILSRFV